MIDAKRMLRLQDNDKPDIEAITKAVSEYEANMRGAGGDLRRGR